jgi:hypothetical protein
MGKKDRPFPPILRAIDGLRALVVGVFFIVLGCDGIYEGNTSIRIVGAVGVVAGLFVIRLVLRDMAAAGRGK